MQVFLSAIFVIFLQLCCSSDAKSLSVNGLNRTTNVPVSNGPITVGRDIHDHIYDYGGWNCFISKRLHGNSKVCTCNNDVGGTIVSQSGDSWDCNTNHELNCEYSLGGEDGKGMYIIDEDSRNSVEFVPTLPPHLTIKNIFVWNYGKVGIYKGNWELVTDVASYFISLRGNGNALSIQNLDLDVWKGQVIKIHFGEYKKCVHAKIRGKIRYPFDVVEFKQKVMNTTVITTTAPKTTTPGPTVTSSVPKTTTPGPTVTSSAPKTTTPGPTGTASTPAQTTPSKTTPRTTTTPKKKKHSAEATVIFVVAILLIIVLVVTASYFIYRWCTKYRSTSEEEKNNEVIFKNTNYYEKSDAVKPVNDVAVKNGKAFTGIDNIGHDHETVDEVGRDVAKKSANGDVKSHDTATVKGANDGNKIIDSASSAQLCMNLYSDAMDETSSEEDVERNG